MSGQPASSPRTGLGGRKSAELRAVAVAGSPAAAPGGPAGVTLPGPGDRLDLSQVFSHPPPHIDFVLPGLPTGMVGSLVSPGGTGKSMYSLQLGAVVAGGGTFTSLMGDMGEDAPPVKTGRVIFLAAEDPEIIIKHRLHGLGSHLEPGQRDRVISQLNVWSLLGKAPNIMHPDWFDWVVAACSQARLVIIDTLRRIHDLDENDSAAMSQLVGQLERICQLTGCTVIFLHHTAKSAAMNGQGDQAGASRGSSVLSDNIRWQSNLVGMTGPEAAHFGLGEENKSFYVRWTVSKQNYGKPLKGRWLRRAAGGILVPDDLDGGWSAAAKQQQSPQSRGKPRAKA